MKKTFIVLFLFIGIVVNAQHEAIPFNDELTVAPPDSVWKKESRLIRILREFRFQAYIQPEWQRADTSGKTADGSPLGIDGVGSFQGGTFPAAANNRFLLRRARFKFSFEHKNAKDLKIMEFAFQFDAFDYNNRGSTLLKEFYGRIIDPWIGWFSLQGGIFVRPFGMESTISPAFNESPEFSRVNQVTLPNESELGEAIIIESPAKFEKVYVRVDACVVNGQGVGVGFQTGTYQNHKDFIGRIKVAKMWNVGESKIGFNATASYYNGGVLQATGHVYQLQKDSTNLWTYHDIADPTMQLKKNYKREYYGAHLEFKADYPIGITTIRGEFIGGLQPGGQTTSLVPVGTQLNSPPTSDLYLRKFNGAMFCLNQAFKQKFKNQTIMHDFTLKYDWYDPQTQYKGTDLTSMGQFPITDIKYSTIGAGYAITPYNWFKLMIWYDHVMNEKTNIDGWKSDFKKDDVLTIRTQFYVDTWWFNQKSKYKDNLMTKRY